MKFLILSESLALIAAGLYVWRQVRVGEPRRGHPFATFTLALILQLILLLSVTLLSDWLRRSDGGNDRMATFTALVAVIQILRTMVLAWAVRSWLIAVKSRLVRSWRGILILLCLALIAFFPSATYGWGFLLLVPLFRLKWVHAIHGWSRAGMFVVLGILTFALNFDVSVTVLDGALDHVSTTFGIGRSYNIVQGDMPPTIRAVTDLLRPWEHAIRTMLVLLHLQVLTGFIQLLVLPVHLKGLSLKRRFTVTLAMYRFIPGTLALIFMILIAYLGIGLHRTTIIRGIMDNTLEKGLQSADMLLFKQDSPLTHTPDPVEPIARIIDPLAMHPNEHAFAVVRQLKWAATGDDSLKAGTGFCLAQPYAASPGTPDTILARNFFADMPEDSSIGMVELHGTLYLRSARILRTGNGGIGAEVLVTLDSLYLTHLASKIQSDIRVDVSPKVSIGRTNVNIGDDAGMAWIDSSFTIKAPFPRKTEHDDFWERSHYLARAFLPLGNWLKPLGENDRIGAVQLRLSTSPRSLYESLTGSTLTLATHAFAIFILAAIGFLFLIVELSAVRTGRSIIKGIVTDVKSLSEAAKKFGQGDLKHRIALSGKDEISQLAATFNTMAADIEHHQEVLLEKERLEADLALARDIQQRMLPQEPPAVPGLDVAGLSIPSREVGGDLFYFLPIPDGRLGLTIGDVSGKSVPAALLMSNVLAALKSEARIVDKEDEILDHLNRLIVDQVEPGRFVTFFYGVVDPKKRSLRYACAGHNPPLLMRSSGEGEWLKEAGMPLGIIAESTYTPAETTLNQGDVLVLYSDGVTEAQRKNHSRTADAGEGSRHEDIFFDEHRLEAAVRNTHDRSAADIIRHVMDEIHAYTEGAEQSDDLTLVVVRLLT